MTPAPKPADEGDSSVGSGAGASGGWDDKDAAVVKTAGLMVFSGIALSIIKTLIAKPQPDRLAEQQWQQPPTHASPQMSHQTADPILRPHSQPPPQPSALEVGSNRTVQIVRGDTLWGLSQRYGVSVGAIKEANGLQGDTIYAGRKLIIPSSD